jgi:hypothetical protein
MPVRAEAGREVGGLMSEAAVAESMTIAAVPERVGLARAPVGRRVHDASTCAWLSHAGSASRDA